MKTIEILLIVILILATILGIRIHNSNKKPEYTLRDIQLILKKSEQLTNYECEINFGEFKYYKRKNNKISLQSNSNQMIYRDYDKNMQITCKDLDNKKFYIESNISIQEIPSSNLYTATFSADELPIQGFKLKNVKKENYNGANCLKTEFENKEEKTSIFWIDINTGLVMKVDFLDGTKNEYKYKFDTVTESDVTPPDLTGYTKIEADL